MSCQSNYSLEEVSNLELNDVEQAEHCKRKVLVKYRSRSKQKLRLASRLPSEAPTKKRTLKIKVALRLILCLHFFQLRHYDQGIVLILDSKDSWHCGPLSSNKIAIILFWLDDNQEEAQSCIDAIYEQ